MDVSLKYKNSQNNEECFCTYALPADAALTNSTGPSGIGFHCSKAAPCADR